MQSFLVPISDYSVKEHSNIDYFGVAGKMSVLTWAANQSIFF